MNTKLEPMAIMMCAKKIAAMAGDARKALDVLRRATEIAGRDRSEKVKISHVNEVLNQTYTDRSGAELPFHQQGLHELILQTPHFLVCHKSYS